MKVMAKWLYEKEKERVGQELLGFTLHLNRYIQSLAFCASFMGD